MVEIAYSTQPSALSHQNSAISTQPSELSHQNSAIRTQPSRVTCQDSASRRSCGPDAYLKSESSGASSGWAAVQERSSRSSCKALPKLLEFSCGTVTAESRDRQTPRSMQVPGPHPFPDRRS